MPVSACPHCGARLNTPPSVLGKEVVCSQCHQRFTASGPGGGPAAPTANSARPATAPLVAPPHEQIGQCRLLRRLGRGGMGEVWLAEDTMLKREVAVKLLPESVSDNQRNVQRFLREARSAAKLNHPNVVMVYQVGEHAGRIFIVMEYVEGGTLSDEIKRRGAIGWREATEAIRGAAAGLAAAHEVGLVHRDIKPSNLMRTPKGTVKVADFGLARAQEDSIQVTRPGTVLGTPAYMSPEQGRGQDVDARADLYSLTCAYYALLTGRAPYEGTTSTAVIYQHVHEPFPDPRQAVGDLPEGACRILRRGACKDPLDRYQTAEEMIAALDAVLAGRDVPDAGPTTLRPVASPAPPAMGAYAAQGAWVPTATPPASPSISGRTITPPTHAPAPAPPQFTPPPTPVPGVAPPGPASGVRLPGSGWATASLILGIGSLVTCWAYGIVPVAMGILAIHFCGRALRDIAAGKASAGSAGSARAGRVCGIIGIVLGAIVGAMILLGLAIDGFDL